MGYRTHIQTLPLRAREVNINWLKSGITINDYLPCWFC